MQTIHATIIRQSKHPAMNYLALGNDVYFIRDGALHCRSEGATFQIDWRDLDDESIEYYANLHYYLEQIEQLTKEYTSSVFSK